jgi:hypothetical protein
MFALHSYLSYLYSNVGGVGQAVRKVPQLRTGIEKCRVLQSGEGPLEEVQVAREDHEHQAGRYQQMDGGTVQEGTHIEDSQII